jgi:HEPN domain-containing protein
VRARDNPEILLRKAKQDEFTVEKLLPDPDSPDSILGFHAQQAIEKSLKAVLAHKSVRYRLTHDLTELLDLLLDNKIAFPPEFQEVRRLTPFGAALRYGDLPDELEEPFDRAWALNWVRQVRTWAESVLGEQPTG